MNDLTYFERLVASAHRIARHPWHPGKEQAIDLAVEGLVMAVLIDSEERVVLGGRSNAA
ncbi:hypothetical protein [Tautonia plasticadhaerens]|uniref:Uncharacterized protein n=1 Tax=Tautonia plasticadhaerens TaxID=2527974 RepID=A0A518HEI4_9BACT|nr:hypothetical protein [Tautonia plasticadhaerens]QDV39260.1 hypothetical protein ElP_72240 [Tautonia plasticadhaerens]